MVTRLTSDPHYWHSRVIEYCKRPFATAEEMNEAMITRWNAVVGHQDVTYILGDFCFAGPVKAEAIMERLNGGKILIAGNHDWKVPTNRWLKMSGVVQVLPKGELKVGKHTVLLNHFPYPYAGTSRYDDRYPEHRPQDRGSWLLHGHVHGAWKKRGRCINVGCDVWNFRPVELHEIEALMLGGENEIPKGP